MDEEITGSMELPACANGGVGLGYALKKTEEEEGIGPTVGDWQERKGSSVWLGRWI